MSDKFFFKGRQDARQNHVKFGYKTKADVKVGSKKNPLTLVVKSEQRRKEVEVMVSDAGLYADISIASGDDVSENIAELSVLLEKHKTITREKTPARNDPCSCGSAKKYKKCCG